MTPITRTLAATMAQAYLRQALACAKAAGAPRLADRIRLAITSAGGAVRHAQGREGRT